MIPTNSHGPAFPVSARTYDCVVWICRCSVWPCLTVACVLSCWVEQEAGEDDNESKVTFETLPVYTGTPRRLLFFQESGKQHILKVAIVTLMRKASHGSLSPCLLLTASCECWCPCPQTGST